MRRRLRPWIWLLPALVVVIAVATALVTREAARVVAERLSTASGLDVTIADLDLSLWPFGVAADDVVVRFPGAPEPSLTAERLVLVVDARTLPQRLWAGRPHVRRARLVAPHLHLERARDGRLVLAGAPAAPTVEERTPGPPAPPAPVALRVDRLDVARGMLVFDDATRSPMRRTELGIDTLSVSGLAIREDGGLADAAFAGRFSRGDARAALTGRYAARDDGVRLRMRADLSDLALVDVAPYVGPELLHGGTVSGRVDYRWRPTSRLPALRLQGPVVVKDLDAGDGRTVPRTTVRLLRARDTDIDLGTQRVRVAQLTLDGAVVQLPPPVKQTAKRPATSGDPAWDFAADRLVVRDATVQPAAASGWPAVAVRALAGRDLASGWTSGGLTAAATLASGGRVRARIVFDPRDGWTWMRVKADAIALPALARGLVPERLRVDDGVLRAQATVLTPPLRLSAGRVAVDKLGIVAPRAGGSDPVLALDGARLRVWSLALDPLDASLGPLELSWPYLVVRRDPEGVYPLHLLGAPAGGPAPAARSGPPGRVMLQSLAVRDGTIFFEDRVVHGGFFGSVSQLQATAYGLYGLPVRIGDATLAGNLNEVAPLGFSGYLSETTSVRGDVSQLPLAPLNPYVGPATGWVADGGTVDLGATVALRDETVDATAKVVLVHADLRRAGDVDVLGRLVGVPLTTALRLMQDTRGRVELEFPVQGALDAPGVQLNGLIVGAVGRAIAGAITSPLTLLGSAFARGEAPPELVLAPVPFAPGTSALDATAERRLDLLAVLLGQKPDLVLALTGSSGAADAAALGDDRSRDALATLARARADAVVQRLVDRYRIDPARLRVAPTVRTDVDASVALSPVTD